MNLDERVRHLFGLDIESKIAAVDTISSRIANAGQRLVDCLLNDGKIFICGLGGSAANCLHFSVAMLQGFGVERPPLPVINLTTDIGLMTAVTNDNHQEQVFSRQIQALAKPPDVLIVLSTSNHANSLLSAVTAAHEADLDIIALSGRDGGILTNHLGPDDIEIRIQSDQEVRIQEMHLFILHCFSDLIDRSLFGQDEL